MKYATNCDRCKGKTPAFIGSWGWACSFCNAPLNLEDVIFEPECKDELPDHIEHSIGD